jgi:hypothetical protein
MSDESEIKNTYKSNGKEIIVLTGRNPKCPNGFKILKTDIDNKDSNTKVIICVKGDIIDSTAERGLERRQSPLPENHKLDHNDVLSLAVSDREFDGLRFPFIVRTDAFNNESKELEESKEPSESIESYNLLFIVLMFIIILGCYINKKELNIKKEQNIKKEND